MSKWYNDINSPQFSSWDEAEEGRTDYNDDCELVLDGSIGRVGSIEYKPMRCIWCGKKELVKTNLAEKYGEDWRAISDSKYSTML